ncbi:MAG TPA: hypothetical protein PLW44_07980 [Chitinophagales bacterium]|nr:hypothetical protein [Chitinophagales bacterium]
MNDIIYSLDNWSIIKLVGGLGVVILGLISILNNVLLSSHKFHLDRSIEKFKNELNKENSLLNSIIQNHFSSSQKLIENKIVAYSKLWECTLFVKDTFPSSVSLVFFLFPDRWFLQKNAFEELTKSDKMVAGLDSIEENYVVNKILTSQPNLLIHKFYLSDVSYNLFFTYRALIGRVTNEFLFAYRNKEVYFWKSDEFLVEMLKVSLSPDELKYVMEAKVDSLKILMDLIEVKIVQEIRANIGISNSPADTIKVVKDIEKIFITTK